MNIGGKDVGLVRKRLDTTRYKYAFDGINDGIRVPYFDDLNIGTGGFTMHFWLQCGTNINTNFNLFLYLNASNYIRFLWASESGGNNRIILVENSISGSSVLPINTGYNNSTAPNNFKYTYAHVAIVCEATGTWWLYVNGIRYATGTDGRDFTSNFELYIQGLFSQFQVATIDRFRFIKGQALWTGGTNGQTVFNPATIDYTTFPTNGIYFPAFKPTNWNIDQGSNTFVAKNQTGNMNGIISGRTTGDIASFYITV